jgi:putative endonuclease
MSLTKQTGNDGEELAQKFVVEQGFKILHTNWRHKNLEVDNITKKEEILHSIEVKTRQYSPFGYPGNNVKQQKMNALKNAASVYLEKNPQWHSIQFDVIAITLQNNLVKEMCWIDDVFY